MGRVGLPLEDPVLMASIRKGDIDTEQLLAQQKHHIPGVTEIAESAVMIEAPEGVQAGGRGPAGVSGHSRQIWQEGAAEVLRHSFRHATTYAGETAGPAVRSFYTRCEPALREDERALTYPVLAASALLWTLCLATGLLLHAGAAPSHIVRQTHYLPFLWFDKLLRVWGVLLAAPVLALRYAANLCSQRQRSWVVARRDHHFAEAAAFYATLALFRIVVYLLHTLRIIWFGVYIIAGAQAGAAVDVMSDHFFLASCIASVLTVEGCLACVEWRRSQEPPERGFLLIAGMAWAGTVYTLLSLDMLYTARFFHGRPETFWGAFAGLCFPLAAYLWMLYGVKGQGDGQVSSERS